MLDAVTSGIRKWIVELFVAAIKNTSRPEDRHAAIQWLLKSRDILASDLSMTEKLKALNALLNASAAVKGLASSVPDMDTLVLWDNNAGAFDLTSSSTLQLDNRLTGAFTGSRYGNSSSYLAGGEKSRAVG